MNMDLAVFLWYYLLKSYKGRQKNENMKELKNFPECDGHIESVLIGCRIAKVSFQTWNAKKLVIIYNDVESVKEQNSVFGDISEYRAEKMTDLINMTF